MKKQLVAILSLSLVLIFVLSACASAPAATVTVAPPAVQEATSALATQPVAEVTEAPVEPTVVQAGVKLSDAEMQAFLTEKLKGSPHTLEFILKQEKNAEEWNKTITRMIGNGAKINEEEKQLLIDWLVSR